MEVRAIESAPAFLRHYQPCPPECLLLDLRMPGVSGLELQGTLRERNISLPIVFLTAHGDVTTSVQAMKAGATDFITKPFDPDLLLEVLQGALRLSESQARAAAAAQERQQTLEKLTARERSVFELAIAGHRSKEIARQLGISHRTVEIHRTQVLRKFGAASFMDLMTSADPGDPARE